MGGRVSVEASMAEVVFTAVVAGEGNFDAPETNETDDTEKQHAHKQDDT